MSPWLRRRILRGNAAFLTVSGAVALFVLDVPGIWFSVGPTAAILGGAQQAGVGFVEAHGLAIVLGLVFWQASRAVPEPRWHAIGCGTHALLGTANVLFWEGYVEGGVLWIGYLTTALHVVFVLAHAIALGTARRDRDGSRPVPVGGQRA